MTSVRSVGEATTGCIRAAGAERGRPSGAKAQVLCGCFGTTEVVPFQSPIDAISCSLIEILLCSLIEILLCSLIEILLCSLMEILLCSLMEILLLRGVLYCASRSRSG
jgi:hypothetical protein